MTDWNFTAIASAHAAVLGGLIFGSPAHAGDLVKEIFNPVVQVDDGCTGTVIYSDRNKESGDVKTIILSAKHCLTKIKDNQNLKVKSITADDDGNIVAETNYNAKLLGTSYKVDLGIIELRDKDKIFPSVAKLENADTRLNPGEIVISYGYALAFVPPTMVSGYLGLKQNISVSGGNFQDFLRASTPLAGGNSGGPLFHVALDGSYKIIGVVTGAVPSFPEVAIFTSIDDIEAYLKVALPEVYSTPTK